MPDDFDFSRTRPVGPQTPPAGAPSAGATMPIAPPTDFDFSRAAPVGGPKPRPEPRPWYQPIEDFTGGAMQGAIYDPITGINQLLEHVSNNKIGLSDATKKELEDFKNKYTGEGKTAGNIGRGAGAVGSVLLPAAWGVGGARAMGFGARTATGAGLGALAGAVQPVEGDKKDFKKQKQGQILAGAGTGAFAGPIGAAGSVALAEQFIDNYGWSVAGPLFAGLGALAARHAGRHPWGVMGSMAKGAHQLLDRPGGQYAVGRGVQTFKPGDINERLDKND